MPSYLGNFTNTQTGICGIPLIPGNLRNSLNIQSFEKISKIIKIYHSQIPLEIWEISGIPEMPVNLGNSPNTWEFNLI